MCIDELVNYDHIYKLTSCIESFQIKSIESVNFRPQQSINTNFYWTV